MFCLHAKELPILHISLYCMSSGAWSYLACHWWIYPVHHWEELRICHAYTQEPRSLCVSSFSVRVGDAGWLYDLPCVFFMSLANLHKISLGGVTDVPRLYPGTLFFMRLLLWFKSRWCCMDIWSTLYIFLRVTGYSTQCIIGKRLKCATRIPRIIFFLCVSSLVWE